MAGQYLHLHPTVDPPQWVRELSQYDAGWLHFFRSENHGELRRANWDDLNYPARMATLAAAGLPLLQRDNSGSIVAIQSLARHHEIELFFSSIEELGAQLRDTARLYAVRSNVWRCRPSFTFDHHVPRLVQFFRRTIERREKGRSRSRTRRG